MRVRSRVTSAVREELQPDGSGRLSASDAIKDAAQQGSLKIDHHFTDNVVSGVNNRDYYTYVGFVHVQGPVHGGQHDHDHAHA